MDFNKYAMVATKKKYHVSETWLGLSALSFCEGDMWPTFLKSTFVCISPIVF